MADNGIPDHPASWLMATAKHLAVDAYRRRVTLTRKVAELAHETYEAQEEDPMASVDEDLDDVVPDDLLRLIFLTCHPALTTESQVALTLRTVGGLTTREIARAFLVPEPTVGQRISRAKKTLADASALRAAAARGAARPARGRSRRRLPRLQRGLCGHLRRRLGHVRSCATTRSGSAGCW